MPQVAIISPANRKKGTANSVNEFSPPKIFWGMMAMIVELPEAKM